MIRVRSCGLALIQDRGRHGFEDIGVPVSGAFDRVRYEQATALLNASGSPVIELVAGGLVLETTVTFHTAVIGPAHVLLDGATVGAHQVVAVPSGSQLTVERIRDGRGPIYAGIAGLSVDQVLGSASRDTLSGLGPDPLAANATLTVDPTEAVRASIGRFVRPSENNSSGVIRAVSGPHLPLTTGEFIVTAVSRSGVRLRPLQHHSDATDSQRATLPSIPVRPGAVQVTPSGEVIILGPDAGVTGGYPLMGVVPDVDSPLVARLITGDRVTFAAMDPLRALDLDARAAEQSPVVHDLGQAQHLG
jgi:allophanate hydrolase subunit 2